MRRFFILLICSLILAACLGKPAATQPAAVNTPVRPTSAAPTETAAATLTVKLRPTLPATATMQPTPTSNIKAAELANPLYLLAGEDWDKGQDLYRLMPGSQAVEHLNPAGEAVTCFDLWKGGERLAFGTKQGKVYTQARGEPPRVLVNAALNSTYPVKITGIRWSPDGQRLAYTVDLREVELYKIPYPTRPSGLWIIDIQKKKNIWLISNNYVPPGAEDVSVIRGFKDPIWSPDGSALIVHDLHWEGSERVWFDPIQPVKDDSALIRAGGEWADAAWALDSQGVYLSGLEYSSSSSDLLWLSRDGKQRKVLIDGTANALGVGETFVFQNSILFIASEEKGRFLYAASTMIDPIQWFKISPTPICKTDGFLILRSIHAKGPSDHRISILCGRDLKLFSLDGNSIEQIDLHAQLKTVDAPIIAIQWGAE